MSVSSIAPQETCYKCVFGATLFIPPQQQYIQCVLLALDGGWTVSLVYLVHLQQAQTSQLALSVRFNVLLWLRETNVSYCQ